MRSSLFFKFYLLGSLLGLFPLTPSAWSSDHWVGIDLGGGYQSFSSSLIGNNSQTGGFFNGRAVLELRNLTFGELSTGLGFQQTWQRGVTGNNLQSMVTRLPTWDLGYFHSFFMEKLFLGALIRNEFGDGAQYNISAVSSFQWLLSVGPQVEYRLPLKLLQRDGEAILNVAGLYGVTGGSQRIFQVPVAVGLRLPLEPGARTDEPEQAPHPVTPPPLSNTTPVTEPTPILPNEDIAAGEIAQVLPDGVKVTLPVSRVYFELGESKLDAEGEKYLDALVEVFKEQSDNWEKLDVSGHTDRRGSDKVNREISHKRARIVTHKMIEKGIPVARLHSRGAGASEPIDDRDTEEGWKRNRRVEIKVLTGDKDPHILANALNDLDRKFKSGTENGANHE